MTVFHAFPKNPVVSSPSHGDSQSCCAANKKFGTNATKSKNDVKNRESDWNLIGGLYQNSKNNPNFSHPFAKKVLFYIVISTFSS